MHWGKYKPWGGGRVLLGLIFQSNLKLQANSDAMCKKAYARLWMLRRLKKLGASSSEMLDVFYKQIRCVLEMAVAVWESGLTKAQSKQLERVQQCAFYIIMGSSYTNYEAAVIFLGSERLICQKHIVMLIICIEMWEKSEVPKLVYTVWSKSSTSTKYQKWQVKQHY